MEMPLNDSILQRLGHLMLLQLSDHRLRILSRVFDDDKQPRVVPMQHIPCLHTIALLATGDLDGARDTLQLVCRRVPLLHHTQIVEHPI